DGREEPVPRGDGLRAGVEEEEAARPVGVLREARREARLAEERRLLVAGEARDRDRGVADASLREDSGGRDDVREDVARDAEEREELVVPVASVDVVEERAARVGGVGRVDGAAREVPDEPAVDRPERELSALGPEPRSWDVVEQPRELRAREVR